MHGWQRYRSMPPASLYFARHDQMACALDSNAPDSKYKWGFNTT
jgi:hypothetical protein